ncbi:MAG: hypothetical protein PHV59_05770 [Victivallales bacterium]|nr:hypothetical protein [Victivallales bacterium]
MANEADIKKFMAQKLSEGRSLAEIQKLIEEEFQQRMTFLEVRLMASNLVDWEKEVEKANADREAEKTEQAENAEDDVTNDSSAASDSPGKCVVELSKLVKPGAIAHGSVKFPSGASGSWLLDQMGRLGLEKTSAKPTEEDLQAFQQELQKLFAHG